MKLQRWLASSVAVVIVAGVLSAQTPKPTFEVASVKKQVGPPPPPITNSPQLLQHGVFRRRATVASLIQFGYGVRDLQIVGGPDWIRQDRFEVYAKAAEEVPVAQMRLMVQSLLEDRFGLTLHRDQREMRHLALVLARSDGRLGQYLHRMEKPCDLAKLMDAEKSRPKPAARAEVGITCGSLENFADLASRFVGLELPVFDRTGLTGTWSFMVYFAPDPDLSPFPLAVEPDPSLGSFRVALREQLGLILEERRGPIDVQVIDSVQQPTEN